MLERFHYKTKSGKEVVLPRFDNIPFGVIRNLRKETETEQFFGLVEGVASAAVLAIIDTLPQSEIKDMMTEWQKESGVELGESSGS